MEEDHCGHLYEEVEKSVRTWMKKQSVQICCDIFQKLIHRWQKGMQNGSDYVDKYK
jgi:hypothetical protein